jgi:hypothetical protein
MVQLRRDLFYITHKLFQGISMDEFTAANYEWTLPTTTVIYNYSRIGHHNHVECTRNWRQLGLNLHTSRTIAGALNMIAMYSMSITESQTIWKLMMSLISEMPYHIIAH